MKKGSALLVVLGMLAFMLISAVSFSAYMRYARLPSSFLRRSSASRMLAKAALAEAIDEIDAAIGNNPHPGLGTRQPRRGAGSLNAGKNGIQNENNQTRNTWLHRVYIGTNAVDEADLQNKLVDPDETISTLTLEGLAYIPPALVNEARYYSRRSRAGIWKPLGFDSGRYAFCAIDVSDHFDVNALSAKYGRSSSPAGRISLAYLFEKYGDPTKWDDFLKEANARNVSSAEAEQTDDDAGGKNKDTVPFVSVADLNLALGEHKPYGEEIKSPFVEYIRNSSSDFYSGIDPTGDAADKIRALSFVSDGLFPYSSGVVDEQSGDSVYARRPLLDLFDDETQPFTEVELTDGDHSLRWFVNNAEKMDAIKNVAGRVSKRFSSLGLALLKDYLDPDNLPLSLSIPQVERTPMIAGFNLPMSNGTLEEGTLNFSENIEEEGNPGDPSYGGFVKGDDKMRVVKQTIHYKLDPSKANLMQVFRGLLNVILVYPFRRGPDLYEPAMNDGQFKFKLEGNIAFFFSDGNLKFREAFDFLQLNADSFDSKKNTVILPAENEIAVFRIPFEISNDCSFDPVEKHSDAVRDFQYDLTLAPNDPLAKISEHIEKLDIFKVVKQWEQTPIKDPMDSSKILGWTPNTPPDDAVIIEASSAIRPVVPVKGLQDMNLASKGSEKELQVCAAVWLRVVNGFGQTVDLVPASPFDDDTFVKDGSFGNELILENYFGHRYPLIVFSSGNVGFKVGFDKDGHVSLPVNTDIKFQLFPDGNNQNKVIMCADPRWNWAPEQWYAKDMGGITGANWINEVVESHSILGKDGRDKDIFLMTSDLGRLQSVYELAMLPRIRDNVNKEQSGSVCGDMNNSESGGTFSPQNATWAQNFDAAYNSHRMWRSYHLWDTEDHDRDDFESFRIVNDGNGFRVNPFSDDENILRAAFENSPYDWWAAGVPDVANGGGAGRVQHLSGNQRGASLFNSQFAFSSKNTTDGNISSENMLRLVRSFKSRVKTRIENQDAATWQEAYDGCEYGEYKGEEEEREHNIIKEDDEFMDWDQEFDNLAAASGYNPALSDVDRRFLYGYWRECLAAKQQLFLVFVRAEPTMMGGGAKGATPPQLGARAVALVWRDPTASPDDKTPHRTRVLFYRQFD